MDLVKILKDTVAALPAGEYSSGLTAILRHISVAVRHFEGLSGSHSDRFTDAIYRTNQAYEGSLKEAYRVLANKDPANKSPHQIEKYLEQNNILRPRVLTQITRYRHDYRNPSTHDYKLDFDQSEALLAITSTCGFAKLLIDQISEKIAFNNAVLHSTILPNEILKFKTIDELSLYASNIARAYLTENPKIQYSYHLIGSLSGKFTSAGFEVKNDVKDFMDETFDIFLEYNNFHIPVEVRSFEEDFSLEDSHALGYLDMVLEEMEFPTGINIIHSNNSKNAAKIIKCSSGNKIIYVVTQYHVDDIKKICNEFNDYQII